MTTVINNPGDNKSDAMGSGSGVVIGASIVVLALVILSIFALPYIRKNFDAMSTPKNPTINVTLPTMATPNP